MSEPVDCKAARELIGAVPTAPGPQAEAHLAGCPQCRGYRDEMLELERRLQRALELGPLLPSRGNTTRARVLPLQPRRTRRWNAGLGLAASLLIGVFCVVALWALRPTDTLAHELVLHVQAESRSWAAREPVTQAELARILRHAGVELDAARVSYARSCWFRGHYVPHLVLQTASGPVTVLLLGNEHVTAATPFDEDHLQGTLLPAPHGSLAVLARASTDLDAATREVSSALKWR